jgi:hypothetical protein
MLTLNREVSRALWTGVAADALDIGSLVYGIAMGQVGRTTGGLFSAAAIGALGLGIAGLRSL